MKNLFDSLAFGNELRRRILKLGLSYRTAAPLIRVDKSTLNRTANGKPPDVENYLRMIKWLEKHSKS